ncbi:MAG: kinase [Pseudomonadota bacterium]
MAVESIALNAFIEKHRLPAAYATSAHQHFLPHIESLTERLRHCEDRPRVIGINGAQGTGKSTLADLIADSVARCSDNRVAVISIDDLYHTRQTREELAANVHPLLRTRGVPGTHDVAMGCELLSKLRSLPAGKTCLIPRFDKSTDDRAAKADWDRVDGPLDLIILEGWCVGSTACDAGSLVTAMNALEEDADPDSTWRRFVNEQLTHQYPALFEPLDELWFLRAPSFEAVARWRLEQEHKLKARVGGKGDGIMDDAAVARFIQHYERITRHNLRTLPTIADVMIELAEDHSAVSSIGY